MAGTKYGSGEVFSKMLETHLYALLICCFKYFKPNLQKSSPYLLSEAFFQPKDSFRCFAEHQHSPPLDVLIPHLKNTLIILWNLKKKKKVTKKRAKQIKKNPTKYKLKKKLKKIKK